MTATAREDYDAAIVGASLAGCATAILLAREGARVALIDKRPDPAAFKRICGHYFQSSAVPALERLGLLEAMEAAGAVRSRIRMWTRWGWIEPCADSALPSGVNLRRELLDPLIRGMAAETAGVDLILDRTAQELLSEDGRVSGVRIGDRQGNSTRLRARLVVGADGRDSNVAQLAAVRVRTKPHGRFCYSAYFEGPPPAGAPDSSAWMTDPQWAGAFVTDEGLTMYAAMPTNERLPEFRRDPAAALIAYMADLPDPPPILASRMVGQVIGKLDMTNVIHTPTAPGLALVGDAALATDPIFGVGCGWALQSAEWLAESVAPALAADPGRSSAGDSLSDGLNAYGRRHARMLRGHALLIHGYATGRSFSPTERLLFSAAARDAGVARIFEAFGTRNIRPARLILTAFPRAIAVNARYSLRRGSGVAGKLAGAGGAVSAPADLATWAGGATRSGGGSAEGVR